jgi:hypothetical protein
MAQNSKVLTGEANSVSLVSAERTTTREDYLIIAERRIPMSTIERGWTFEVGEKGRAGMTAPRLANTLVKIVEWLNHLGGGRVSDSRLEARHDIPDNFRTKGIGL